MGKYRGYVVAKRGPKGRTAMRSTGRTYASKKAAINDMRKDNAKWMEMNYGPKFGDSKNFEYGAVQTGKFQKGPEGNKKLLAWHDANSKGRSELLGKKDFMKRTLQDQLKKTNNFAKRNLYPPGSY